MSNRLFDESSPATATLDDLATLADYSLMATLNCDPDAKANGEDHAPRQVFTGHYVPVNPTPIKDPEYVAHSKHLFHELGFADSMAQSADFVRMFSGDLSQVPQPMQRRGSTKGCCSRTWTAADVSCRSAAMAGSPASSIRPAWWPAIRSAFSGPAGPTRK